MRIPKKRIHPIRLIRKPHLLPQLPPLHLSHRPQNPFIPPIQKIIINPQRHHDKTQRRKRSNDTNLPTDIPGRLLVHKSLRAEDIPQAERNQCHRIGRHFLRMPRHIRRVPREQQHKRRAERSREERSGEEPGFVHWDAVGIEPDHQPRPQYRRQDADKHHHAPVTPSIRQPPHEQHARRSHNPTRRIQDQCLLRRIPERREQNIRKSVQATVRDGREDRGKADEPDADVAEGFEDLGFFEVGVLGARVVVFDAEEGGDFFGVGEAFGFYRGVREEEGDEEAGYYG